MRIPVGIYDSLEELVEAINSANGTYRHQMLEPLKNRKGSYIIRRMCNCPQIHITVFKEKIRRVFGFDEAGQKGSFTTFNEGFRNIAASSPASLSRALPDQMYLYTDNASLMAESISNQVVRVCLCHRSFWDKSIHVLL